MFRTGSLILLLGGAQGFRPEVVSYAELLQEKPPASLDRALSSRGLVQVVGVPGFPGLRRDALRLAHGCIQAAPGARQEHVFEDGTVRRSLVPDGPARLLDGGSGAEACRAFEGKGRALREAVADAASAFGRQLGALAGFDGEGLQQAAGYEKLEALVEQGQRLEHFHSYELGQGGSERPALDFHVDQGLFVAFAPALMLHQGEPVEAVSELLLRGEDGQEQAAELQGDALVFLLGDAVQRLADRAGAERSLPAPSHAVRMPEGQGQHRVWYGLMQLPPSDARAEEGMTYGELRRGAIAGSPLALSCSSGRKARELMTSCDSATSMYCWHRCMDYTSMASPSVCAAKGLDVKCVNQFDQVYVQGHGDFWPTCSNSTTNSTARPKVEQEAACPAFDNNAKEGKGYTHSVTAKDNETYVFFNVVGDKLEVKMVHYGKVGWMALGIENIGASKNGMQGAPVVIGLNDPEAGIEVAEYNIHASNSAFRWWTGPLSPMGVEATELKVTGCVSTLKFKTKSIYGVALNVSATGGFSNRMIWALTHLDYPTKSSGGYAGYHAVANFDRSRARGHVVLAVKEESETAAATAAAVPLLLLAALAALRA